MTKNELITILDSINEQFETEILEVKEADNGFRIRGLTKIRAQPPRDWAKLVIEDAGMEDLDPDALYAVRESMRNKYGERSGLIDSLDDEELLDKTGITIRGRITNAALLLLGREEASALMDGPVPRITWTLYESDGRVRAYEHFGPPFILSIDGVLAKIRNERYRIMDDPESLTPTEVMEYDPWTLRELLGNALAHQDYSGGRRINVAERHDGICVSNSGAFIPGSLERALEPGYKPSYYRNPFLCDAMLRAGLLDQNAMGIRTMCEHARSRRMPLPTFDLGDGTSVEVTVLNHEISPAYTGVLYGQDDLPIATVLALDLVQKKLPVSNRQRDDLFARGLVREANGELIIVATSKDAASQGKHAGGEAGMPPGGEAGMPHTNASLSDAVLAGLAQGPLTRAQLTQDLEPRFDGVANLGERVYRTLRRLEGNGQVTGTGSTRARVWSLVEPE